MPWETPPIRLLDSQFRNLALPASWGSTSWRTEDQTSLSGLQEAERGFHPNFSPWERSPAGGSGAADALRANLVWAWSEKGCEAEADTKLVSYQHLKKKNIWSALHSCKSRSRWDVWTGFPGQCRHRRQCCHRHQSSDTRKERWGCTGMTWWMPYEKAAAVVVFWGFCVYFYYSKGDWSIKTGPWKERF